MNAVKTDFLRKNYYINLKKEPPPQRNKENETEKRKKYET